MSRLFLDLKVAVRTLVRSRFVSALAIVAFALGIGVTTAVFRIFNGVLLRPLPYPHPEEIVAVYDTQPACSTCPASFPKYTDWKARTQVFSAIGGSTGGSVVMTGVGDPTRVRVMSTTASLGDVFGVRPHIGGWLRRPGGSARRPESRGADLRALDRPLCQGAGHHRPETDPQWRADRGDRGHAE